MMAKGSHVVMEEEEKMQEIPGEEGEGEGEQDGALYDRALFA